MKRSALILGFLAGMGLFGGEPLDFKVTPAIREYCHIVRFPQPWRRAPRSGKSLAGISYYDYEIRVSGLVGTRFLVRAFKDLDGPYYADNIYEVDLSDPRAPITPVDEKTWESAAKIPLHRRHRSDPYLRLDSLPGPPRPFGYNGLAFVVTGTRWASPADGAGNRVSPDRSHLVLQSYTGSTGGSEEFEMKLDRHSLFGCHGKAFFDVFNADTGKKLVTIQGKYSICSPSQVFKRTAWVTERYFLIPMGNELERCMVCEFGGGR